VLFRSRTSIMPRRRSKRTSTVLSGATREFGGQLRRSKRKLAVMEEEQAVFGSDYGILPSD